MNKRGFTLIEISIALFLLALISVAIYQATISTFKLRDRLSTEGDFYNEIRIASNIINHDISLIYSPSIIFQNPNKKITQEESSQLEPYLRGAQTAQSMFWGPVTDLSGIRSSHFKGEATSMSFVAVSNLRVYKESQQSTFAKVRYFTKQVSNPLGIDETVLFKTHNTNAFDMDDSEESSAQTFDLLHGIKKFSFRYYNKSKDQWSKRWDTENPEFLNTFPDAIEMEILVERSDRLSFEGTYKFRPEVPINGLQSTL